MNILLACYSSSILHDLLVAQGHQVTSCDLKHAKHSGNHIQDNVLNHLNGPWDLMIGFPPCTYLAKAQEWQYQHSNGRRLAQIRAAHFVIDLFNAPIPMIALENPVGALPRYFRQPNQIVRPWWFGDPYKKEICLWLKDVPPLMASIYSTGRKPISNHTNSRMSQEQRGSVRSSWDYYPGLCAGIADQWGRLIGSSYGPVPHRF